MAALPFANSSAASRLALGGVLGFVLAGLIGLFVVAPVAVARGANGAFAGLYTNVALRLAARFDAPKSIPSSPPGGVGGRGIGFAVAPLRMLETPTSAHAFNAMASMAMARASSAPPQLQWPPT